MGYSYGSLITSLHPILPTIKTTHILISYPLSPRGWLTLFHTGTYNAKLRELVQNADSHVLVVFGDRDEFTSVEKYREWQKSLEEVSSSERLRVVEVGGASHFWRGPSGQQLGEEVKRPLPDERPRGSVANLIGRFENQVKRQPSSSPASARSLSATSHVSGDSAKEEAKERREWPPKSPSPDVKLPIAIPSSSFAQSLALAQAVSAEAIPASHAQAVVAEDASSTRSRSTTSSPDKSKPNIITPPQHQLSIDVIASTPMTAPAGTPTTAKPLTTAKPRPAKTPASAAGKPSTITSGRAPLKSTGLRPSTAPAAHPAKSQSMGPSNSSALTRKAVARPTAPPSNSAGVARATVTAASARPKTPSSTVSRTPSSGLFAPTAASLAKSRSAQQPSVTTSSKKAASSSTAAERLSKPTAASLSRTRAPATAPHTGAKPTTSATRGTSAIKSKASTTKKAGTTSTSKKVAAATTGTGVAIGAAISATTEPGSVSEGMAVPSEESEHQVDDNHIDKNPEDAITSEKLLPEQEENISPAVSTGADETIAADVRLNGEAVEANNEADITSAGDTVESYDASLEHAEKAEMAHVNGGHEPEVMPKAHIGNEIEDMVNLLESMSVSKVRPESLVSIPDEE
ncbi:hypothetical protein C0993_005010 [Termitomyces sp. T159_Od127]|nr:hypothetical protein C0993_005010 [Termitomyces sp. T159_Od127]